MLSLKHTVHDGVLLDEKSCNAVLRHVAELWSYTVRLQEVDAITDVVHRTHEVAAHKPKAEARKVP